MSWLFWLLFSLFGCLWFYLKWNFLLSEWRRFLFCLKQVEEKFIFYWDKLHMLIHLVDRLVKGTASLNKPKVAIGENGNYMRIEYNSGLNQVLFVPYSKNKRMDMMLFHAFLITEEKKINITQEAGVPYLLSAKDLGGIAIEIKNDENNKIERYEGERVPGFAIEILD